MNRIWTSARMFETETLVGSVFKGNHRTEYQSIHSADETLLELLQFDLHTQVNFYKGQPEDKEIWLAGQKLVEAGHYASVADGTDIFHYIPCNPGFRNMLEELEKNIKNSRNWNGNPYPCFSDKVMDWSMMPESSSLRRKILYEE